MRRLWNASYASPSTIAAVSRRAVNWRPGGFVEWAVVIIFAALVILAAVFDVKDFKAALSTNLANVTAKLTSGIIAVSGRRDAAGSAVTGRMTSNKLRSANWYKKFILDLKLRFLPLASAILFLVLGLLFGAHYVFNILDGFGAYCKPSLVAGRPINVNSGNLIAVCKSDDLNSCAQDLSAENGGRVTCDKHDRTAGCTARVAIVDTTDPVHPDQNLYWRRTSNTSWTQRNWPIPAWTFAGSCLRYRRNAVGGLQSS